MVDGSAPQFVLRVEVVVDLRLVGARRGGDRPRRRALETVCRELGQRSVQQRSARCRRSSLTTAWCCDRALARDGWHLAILYHSIYFVQRWRCTDSPRSPWACPTWRRPPRSSRTSACRAGRRRGRRPGWPPATAVTRSTWSRLRVDDCSDSASVPTTATTSPASPIAPTGRRMRRSSSRRPGFSRCVNSRPACVSRSAWPTPTSRRRSATRSTDPARNPSASTCRRRACSRPTRSGRPTSPTSSTAPPISRRRWRSSPT